MDFANSYHEETVHILGQFRDLNISGRPHEGGGSDRCKTQGGQRQCGLSAKKLCSTITC